MDESLNWKSWCEQHYPKMKDVYTQLFPAANVWKPTQQDREFAWELYVELRTRISTQPLHFMSGDEETALDSVFNLFQIVRNLQKKHGGNSFVISSITNVVLNSVIRPFTAKWHKQKLAGKLKAEDPRRNFRAELIEIQEQLKRFQLLLIWIARGEINDGATLEISFAKEKKRVELYNDIPFDRLLGLSTYKEQETIADIVEKEQSEIWQRRITVNPPKAPDPGHDGKIPGTPPDSLVGLAISGGGVRSATFAQGVLCGLAQRGLLKEIDLMSTVSGGGYIGSFISSFLNSAPDAHGTIPDHGMEADKPPFRTEIATDSIAFRHLRNHSRYIQPSNFSDWLATLCQAAYGVISNLLILSVVVFVAVLVTFNFQDDLVQYKDLLGLTPVPSLPEAAWKLWPTTRALMFVSCLLLFFIPLTLRYRWRKKDNLSRVGRWEWATIGGVAVTVVVLVANLLPTIHFGYMCLMKWIGSVLNPDAAMSNNWSLTATTVAIANLGGMLVARGRWIKNLAASFPILGRLTFVALWLCGPILFFYSYFELCRVYIATDVAVAVTILGQDISPINLIRFLLLGTLVYSFLCNVNFTSLHRFYRSRLAKTFVVKPNGTGEPLPIDRLLLSDLRTSPGSRAPYHILNAALNLPSSQIDELRGRDCDLFMFTKHYSGSPVVGYHPTKNWQAADPHLDLGTAMAISGAAAAPQMGLGSIRGASFLMTLLNVRMGYWLRKPYARNESNLWLKKLLGGPGPLYLIREAMSWMSEEYPYLNITDGGHVENLAIYELLRRRCRFILAIDGEYDPELVCPSLMNLQRLARIDFGVEIDITVDRLAWTTHSLAAEDDGETLVEDRTAGKRKPDLSDQRFSRGHFSVGKITYPAITVDSEGKNIEKPVAVTGWLVYIKLSVTGNEPDYVADYRRQHPDFPHQTTNDQVFEEDQYEAYRCLGQHVGESMFPEELFPKTQDPATNLNVHTWVQTLVDGMYEDRCPRRT